MSASPDPDLRRARVRVGVGAALLLVLAALGIAALVAALSPRGGTVEIASSAAPPGGAEGASPAAGRAIFVHVLGQVARPGLYQLTDGARAVDAIAAAGGLTDDADPAAVNLARPVRDGEQLVVPAVGESPPGAPAAGSGGAIDLNAADAATLETLPRIGPALAARIVAWRTEHGPFSTVDDLLAVSGIGSATLDGLRDLVTV